MPRPIPNQKWKGKLWQDPLYHYFETHGKMEFIPGEQYDLTPKEKQAVMERHRIKELLKLEYLKREYDPINRKYHAGVIVDPAIFRWYALDMSQLETFRMTPKSVLFIFGVILIPFFAFTKLSSNYKASYDRQCREGNQLWWDRQHRALTIGGHGISQEPYHV